MLQPRFLFIAALLSLALAAPASAKDTIVGVAHKVPGVSAHDQSPISLYVWEKRPKRIDPKQYAKTGRVILLAHGATISGVPDFDLQLPPDKHGLGYSLMDHLAAQGFDVFSVDIQNYGGSDRVPCGLCVTTQVAANDIGAAVDYIRRLRQVERVYLFGWSWGASTAGLYAQQHPDRVRRLVQYALYLEHSKPGTVGPTEEFRKVDVEQCCRDDFAPAFTDPGVFEAYGAQSLKWHQQAPNGIRLDVSTKMPILDPKRIKVPTLLIYGALDTVCRIDQVELPSYFRDLGTHDKQLVIVPDAGHSMLLEQSRERLYSETVNWFSLTNPITGRDPMHPDQARDFATRYTDAWCSQNPASVAAFFSEQGSLKINDAAPAVGRAALTEAARGFMTAFPDMVVRMDRLDPAGDGFQYHWTLIGTNTGPGGTGNKVHIRGYEEWTLGADGLIARSLGHFDEAEYHRQLRQGAPE